MPVLRLTCPHCDKDVELSVTSVTLSRQCPLCSAKIVLQVPGKSAEGNLIRSSILVAGAEEKPIAPKVAEAVIAPQILEGDVLKRMALDPAVKKKERALSWGAVIVFLTIAALVLGASFNVPGKLQQLYARTQTPKQLATDPALTTTKHYEAPQGPESIAAAKAAARAVLSQGDKALTSSGDASTQPTSLDPELQASPQKRAIAEFLQASSVEERLKHVRDRELMEPTIRAYYGKHDPGAIAFDSVEDWNQNADPTLPANVRPYTVVLPTGERRRALVEPAVGGAYAVDWASFVLYGPMEWWEFHGAKPDQPVVFRVLASPDEYFGGDFKQGSGLICLKFVDPRHSSEEPVYGYAPIASELGRNLLSSMNRAQGRSLPLTVTLKYPPRPGTSNQVWIEKLVADSWYCKGQ